MENKIYVYVFQKVCETPEINTVTGKTRGGWMLASSVLSDSAYQEKVAIHNLLLLVLIVISAREREKREREKIRAVK
ncbi:hypothetical protein J6590_087761 [Homalodisca vitripennis]|nr:hypothetical protein J6590_087761 [Homalodisca vitripennis]